MPQHAHLRVAPDERAARAASSSSRCGRGVQRDPRFDGFVSPAHGELAERLVPHRAARRRVGGRTDDDLAGLGRGLEPARGVDDVAHHGRVAAGAHRADEHLTGVDADAQGHLRRLVGRELLERFLHLQRGAHAAFGVVLVRDRDAEDRDDRVADDLVELAAERAHVGDEALEGAIDEVLHVLGVGRLRERGEPDDVGHEHGDQAALVGSSGKRVPTLGTESGGLGHALTAGRAAHCFRLPGSLDVSVEGVVGPVAQQSPGEDAGGVPVVPRDRQSPRADQLRADAGERLRRVGFGPDRPVLLPQSATLGARAVEAQLLERERRLRAVGPGHGEAVFPIELDRGR